MSINILIIEDEVDIREGISEYLSEVGYEVKVASDGQEGIDLFRQNKFDLVLLDIMLPKINGFGVLSQIRETSNVPVIMLTAMNDDYSQIMSFNEKADDYITKPFSAKVLVAKVKALLKRANTPKDLNISEYNGLKINKSSHEVTINNNEIYLSPKEYDLLIYLTSNEGIALSRDKILDNVWGFDYYGDIRTVDTNIKRLREKLLDKSNYIATVRGSGYKFEVK